MSSFHLQPSTTTLAQILTTAWRSPTLTVARFTEDCQKAPLIHCGEEWQQMMKDFSCNSSKKALDR